MYYFGMKAHIGVDADSGIVHTMTGTPANVHDVTEAHKLLHGDEELALGDAGYTGVEKREEAKDTKVQWHIAMCLGKRRALRDDEIDQLRERYEHVKAHFRAKVEHAFRILKCQFGYQKVRYKGLVKNTAQLTTLFALANIWMMRKRLISG